MILHIYFVTYLIQSHRRWMISKPIVAGKHPLSTPKCQWRKLQRTGTPTLPHTLMFNYMVVAKYNLFACLASTQAISYVFTRRRRIYIKRICEYLIFYLTRCRFLHSWAVYVGGQERDEVVWGWFAMHWRKDRIRSDRRGTRWFVSRVGRGCSRSFLP